MVGKAQMGALAVKVAPGQSGPGKDRMVPVRVHQVALEVVGAPGEKVASEARPKVAACTFPPAA